MITAGRWVVLVVCLGTLAGCGASSGAGSDPQRDACPASDYIKATSPVVIEWKDAVTLTTNTQRMNLPAQIDKLQTVRRSFQSVDAPQCATVAHTAMTQSMDATIASFLDFLAEKEDWRVSMRSELAKTYETVFEQEIERLKTNPNASPIALPVDNVPIAGKLIDAFDAAGYPMKERQLVDGRRAFNGKKGTITVEVILGTDDVLQQVSMLRDTTVYDPSRAQQFVDPAKVVLPDWDSSTWIKKVTSLPSPQRILVGRVVVTYDDRVNALVFNMF